MHSTDPAPEQLAFFATAAAMTALPATSPQYEGLPDDAAGLCQVAAHVLVHEFWADAYGVTDVAARVEELELRPAGAILAAIATRATSAGSLARGLPVGQRLLGNCRQFTVLTCALLRRAGIPARARSGFASYLDQGWTDHWVVEYWNAEAHRWIQADPQLDQLQCERLGVTFDPLDLPPGQFINGSQAWLRCRNGDDPQRYGIFDLRGQWFVQDALIRDLAALNQIELLPWDAWGIMVGPDEQPTEEQLAILDTVAEAVITDHPVAYQEWFRQDGLAVPDVIHSARFDRDVRLR